MPIKKITLLGLYNETNLGDLVIADCTEYLYKQLLDNVQIQKVNLAPKIQIFFFERVFLKLQLFPKECFIITKNKYRQYYEKNIDKISQLIVVVGGGILKFKYQNFAQQLVALVECAETFNIPVVMNSVGVEGFDKKHTGECIWLNKIINKAINKTINKAITTRDDIELLENKWLKNNSTIYRKLVADPAVWVSDVYKIEKNVNSQIIGIGLIRGKIFKANEIEYSEEELIRLYTNIIRELEHKKLSYKLFINGLDLDYDFAVKVCQYIQKEDLIKEILVPKSAKELVNIISGFKGVIAARLHACIISYSLKIPVIGLVWNDKLSFFGRQIGYPERFIETNDFDAKLIVDRMENALQEGYNQKEMQKYKATIKESIKELLQLI